MLLQPDTHQITHPAHYIEGRNFEPIRVIEGFSLCHHLGCVVKYIARAGRKHSLLNDLYKAQWYLERELIRYRDKQALCVSPLRLPPTLQIEDIQNDWRLSPLLGQVLASVLQSQGTPALEDYHLARTQLTSGEFEEFFHHEFGLSKALRLLKRAIDQEGSR